MNFNSYIRHIVRVINPAPVIGGLEVNDNFLRFFWMRGDAPETAVLRLPPGILRDGRVADAEGLRHALAALHAQIAPLDRPLHVVCSFASSAMYSQVFTVPIVAPERLAETTTLNLQMISPIAVEGAYFDAEPVGAGAGGETEFLGAFVERSVVDEVAEALRAAGFVLVAIEFAGLSVARLVRELGLGYAFEEPQLVVHVGSGGIDLLVLRNGNLYFDHFSSWQGALADHDGGRAIDASMLQGMLTREIQRVLNFYSGKWGGSITRAILMTHGAADDIRAVITGNFDMEVAAFTASRFTEFMPQWGTAIGAYLRGLVPRANDTFISLAPVGTEETFARSRARHFVGFWRNAMLAVAGFVFLAVLLADSFVARIEARLTDRSTLGLGAADLQEVQRLEADAKQFNGAVAVALRAREFSAAWSPLFTEVKRIAGTSVTFDRLAFVPSGSSVNISGRANSDLAAINFKNALAKRPGFTDVTLPLANIIPDSDGKVRFQLSFKIASR